MTGLFEQKTEISRLLSTSNLDIHEIRYWNKILNHYLLFINIIIINNINVNKYHLLIASYGIKANTIERS